VATVAAAVFFADGLAALRAAWSLPEYSHGPLIPILSGLLFLRQLKEYPPEPGPKRDRWVGVTVILAAIAMGTLGKLANISDIVAYATILWVGGILLVSFGWKTGRHFWPPVLHLVYMLPLPGVLYFKLNTWLQLVSSELGVFFLQLANVPVYLEGNIIDLGVLRLHVAEACSGLRYLFPILSFSYIFAVLYRGPMWHKAVLLISAAPITVLMNSIRIAVAGIVAQRYGTDWLEGFTHFFEGWVIFICCIVLLFGLAWVLLKFQSRKMSLAEALDLETDGLAEQAARLRLVQPSAAMITAAGIGLAALLAYQAVPERNAGPVARDNFTAFPRTLGDWEQAGRPHRLEDSVAEVLAADDYHSVSLARAATEPQVGLFMAWYPDQSQGGVHSPEICLPGRGMGDRLAGTLRHRRGYRQRDALRHQPRDHPAGRRADDGLLLVPAGRAPRGLGLRGQVLPDGGRHHDRIDRRRAGPADDADRTGRGGCGGGGTAAKRAGRADADPPALRARQLRHVAYAFQPRDILGEGGLNLLAEIGAIPASSLVAGQDRYFIAASHQLGAQAALPGLTRLPFTQPRNALSGELRRGRPVSTHQARHSASSA
jgi:exosortase D (VPLPA-CTERM-specific)